MDQDQALLWEVERILYELNEADRPLPKFLLLENVPSINSSRHRDNFDEWKSVLEELGYYNKFYILNARNFGVPQNRPRAYMLSVLTNNDIEHSKLDSFF